MRRRDFLKLSLYTSATLLGGCGSDGVNSHKTTSTTMLLNLSLRKNRKLPIPPLLDPMPDSNGVKNYNLTIQKSSHSFFEGVQTKTYGINGSYLGPTLLMRNGDSVKINYINRLDEVTTMHGHGMHVPAKMDGGPHQTIKPNSS